MMYVVGRGEKCEDYWVSSIKTLAMIKKYITYYYHKGDIILYASVSTQASPKPPPPSQPPFRSQIADLLTSAMRAIFQFFTRYHVQYYMAGRTEPLS